MLPVYGRANILVSLQRQMAALCEAPKFLVAENDQPLCLANRNDSVAFFLDSASHYKT